MDTIILDFGFCSFPGLESNHFPAPGVFVGLSRVYIAVRVPLKGICRALELETMT